MSISPQQDEPDRGGLERQHGRQRRWSRRTKIGASALGVAIGFVALALILGTRPGEKATTPVEIAQMNAEISVKVPGVPKVDYVIDLNTGFMTPLPEAIIRSLTKSGETSQYAASPDGSLLAYVGTGDDGTPQIFSAGIDGTGVRQVTHDSREAMSPAWSPDGTRVAYGGYGAGKVRNLFVADVATGESTQITDGARDVWGAQFTPDGSSLVYTRGPDYQPVLWTVPVDGGKSTILFGRLRGGMNDAANGSLSPDGSLVTMMGSEIGGPGAIRFVANADGTELRSIPGRASNPAGTWSPDGSRIVCSASDRVSGGGVIVVDIATGHASPVAEGRAAIWLDSHTLLVGV